MIIRSLKLNNYRVYSGEHFFDLTPKIKYGSNRPIVLFGGLNGSGKTSILSATRLALYGKRSLGQGVSQKAYEEYLLNSIHSGLGQKEPANNAYVELSFTYAKLGERFEYTIYRGWEKTGKGVKETIEIKENNSLLRNLSAEQCQGFLNELIPIGLSNLFFFDGEKISELAEDTKGSALGDAIKRLIGLDLFEVLSNDLGVIIRNAQTKDSPQKSLKRIRELENELTSVEKELNELNSEFESTHVNWVSTKSELEHAEAEYQAKGGAWASSYEEEKNRLNQLIGEKKAIEMAVREKIAGDFPLGLMSNYANSVVKQLGIEKAQNEKTLIAKYLKSDENSLIKLLATHNPNNAATSKMMLSILIDHFENSTDFSGAIGIHDISESRYYGIIEKLRKSEISMEETTRLLTRLAQINDDIDMIGSNLSRAPSKESIQNEYEELQSLRKSESKLKTKRILISENLKAMLHKKLALLRQLDSATESILSSETQDRAILHARNSRLLLKDFASKMAESKVKDLENEFIRSFARLARKDDIKLTARIDPKTFAVEIIRDNSHIVDKNELSAGEKQIYSISILEALARTSGRKLPVIIDTPLGRLDSKHRKKLVDNYFPNASHQVIILSTDTEVDASFYADLSKNISHAYRVDYDTKTGSSCAKKGYFWRNKKMVKEIA